MTERPSIGFIGAGSAGSILARAWSHAGYAIQAIYSLSGTRAAVLADEIGTVVANSPDQVASLNDLIVLAVPDDVIESVALTLIRANIPIDWNRKAVIHLSGVHSLEVLTALADQGAMVGSLHPAFPFAGNQASVSLYGVVFAIESSNDLLQAWLNGLISAVDGKALWLPYGSKALYHAALVIASNYTVTLYAIAERLLTGTGASQTIVDQLLNALVGATVDNLRTKGLPAALTGPLVRNDTGTVQAHLNELRQVDPALSDLYRKLARFTYPLLEARAVPTHQIEAVLQQDEKYRASDDP